MRPTLEQIEEEIKRLTEMRSRVHHFFGGSGQDHYAAIAAQIRVLKESVEEGDLDDVFGEEKDSVRSSAYDAREWLDGKCKESTLSKGWESLFTS